MSKATDTQDTSFEEIQIPVPWGHISGKWWGPIISQPILALHGWQDNAATFDKLAPLLTRRGHAVLCIDLPGHGYSTQFAKGYLYYGFYDGIHIIRRIVKYFNWKKITLLGHSLGGSIAFEYAASYPAEVERLICLDITSPYFGKDPLYFIDDFGESIDKTLKYEEFPAGKLPKLQFDEAVEMVWKNYNGSLTKESCEILMKRGLKPVGGGLYEFTLDNRMLVARIGIMLPEQINLLAKRIKCKVLNVKGDPGLVDTYRPELYNLILDQLTNAEVVERHIVPGTHHLHLNNPEDCIDVIDNFIRSK